MLPCSDLWASTNGSFLRQVRDSQTKFFRKNKDSVIFCDLEGVSIWNLPCNINLKLFLEKTKLKITVSTSQVASDVMKTKLRKGLIKFSAFGQREIEAECRNKRKHLKHLLPKGIRNIWTTWHFIYESKKNKKMFM